MAIDYRVRRARPTALVTLLAHRHVLAFPVLAFLAVRLLDVLLLAVAAQHQPALAGHIHGYQQAVDMPAAPGFLGVATNWDGQWYLRITRDGYPSHLPTGPDGRVTQNAWAFYPLYPMLVRLVMTPTGLDFAPAAVLVSLATGAAAVTVMYILLRGRLTPFAARATVLLVCTYVAGPAMGVAYTESLALLLLCTALLLLSRRRYVPLLAVLVLLSLTRPVAMALAPVVLIHAVSRYRHRDEDPFPTGQRWLLAGAAAACVALGGLWPALAWLGTGEPSAYLRTMAAWGGGYANMHLGMTLVAPLWEYGGARGLVGAGLIVAMTLALVLRPGTAAWGPELRGWAASYPAYLLMTITPSSSIVRYVLLGFPLMWPFPAPVSSATERRREVVLVTLLAVLGLVSQWFWIRDVFILSHRTGEQPFP